MHHRILDFSQTEVRLRVKNSQLRILRQEELLASVPLDEIAVVLLSHPMISLSLSVLDGLSQAGAVAVVCNRQSIPVGICYPLTGHHLQARIMRHQASAAKPTLKRLWQQVVKVKIRNQAQVLTALFGDDGGLGKVVSTVRSGDSDNREGYSARRYWSLLFGSTGFRRKPKGEDPINTALNYGYGVLRAIMARAISAAGLHPSLGLFHHNKYNPYCLADDLIEPFRPVVDYAVYHLAASHSLEDELTPTVKAAIIKQVTGRYDLNGCQETIFETAAKLAESLAMVFVKDKTTLNLPETVPLDRNPEQSTSYNEAVSTLPRIREKDSLKSAL